MTTTGQKFMLGNIYGYVDLRQTMRAEAGKIIIGYVTTEYNRQGEIVDVRRGDTAKLWFEKGIS